eukprot:1137363-Pelagomonas_calceolata.AAC.2
MQRYPGKAAKNGQRWTYQLPGGTAAEDRAVASRPRVASTATIKLLQAEMHPGVKCVGRALTDRLGGSDCANICNTATARAACKQMLALAVTSTTMNQPRSVGMPCAPLGVVHQQGQEKVARNYAHWNMT